MFIGSYRDRPDTLKIDHTVKFATKAEGQEEQIDRQGKVYHLNDFEITVWDHGEVTAKRRSYVNSEPRATLPNMSISEGEVRIPLEDFASLFLARLTPLELAEGLLRDKEVRTVMIEALGRRYTSLGIEDVDRRKFLHEIKTCVHDVALDRAVEKLNWNEVRGRSITSHYRWEQFKNGVYIQLYEWVTGVLNQVGSDEQKSAFLQRFLTPAKMEELAAQISDPVIRENVGAQWQESRDWWRRRLEELFLKPEPPEPESSDQTEIDF